MEVWEGYRFFGRYSGKIIKVDLDIAKKHHGAVYIVEGIWPSDELISPEIRINKNDHLEEQVRTLVHEIIHLAPRYLGYAARGEELPSELETEIERKTLDFYDNEPLFVWYFRRLVQEAKEETSSIFAA